MKHIKLGWGRVPRTITVPSAAMVLGIKPSVGTTDWASAVRLALAESLDRRLNDCTSVCVLVPDATRKDITGPVLPSILEHLRGMNSVKVIVATGKHPTSTGPPGALIHDAWSPRLRHVGTTGAGTGVRYPPEVLDADLRITLGEIRPHYFAGYAGGAKTLFPGVAGVDGIWRNHELKALPGARLGVVEGNPCRFDMEAAARMAGPTVIVNVVRAADGELAGVVVGDLVEAHRRGVELARSIFEVPAPGLFDTVIVSDCAPVTMNLYQACKLLPPAGALLKPGGHLIVAAACYEGIGPVETINQRIYQLGVRHALPLGHRITLVSEWSQNEVAPTFARWAGSVECALSQRDPGTIAIIPYGGEVVPRLAR